MTHLIKYLFLPLLMLVAVLNSYATVHEVTLTTDNGSAGEFRYEIENASAGDTIIVNVSGIVNLSSSITIPAGGVVVIGPFPIHFSIDGTNFTGSQVFYSSGAKLEISNIGFVNFPNSTFFNYSGTTTDSLKVKSCLFENNNSGSSTILYSINPNLKSWFDACSFIGNTSNSDGGCFLIGNSVSSGGNVLFTNNTFKENTDFITNYIGPGGDD